MSSIRKLVSIKGTAASFDISKFNSARRVDNNIIIYLVDKRTYKIPLVIGGPSPDYITGCIQDAWDDWRKQELKRDVRKSLLEIFEESQDLLAQDSSLTPFEITNRLLPKIMDLIEDSNGDICLVEECVQEIQQYNHLMINLYKNVDQQRKEALVEQNEQEREAAEEEREVESIEDALEELESVDNDDNKNTNPSEALKEVIKSVCELLTKCAPTQPVVDSASVSTLSLPLKNNIWTILMPLLPLLTKTLEKMPPLPPEMVPLVTFLTQIFNPPSPPPPAPEDSSSDDDQGDEDDEELYSEDSEEEEDEEIYVEEKIEEKVEEKVKDKMEVEEKVENKVETVEDRCAEVGRVFLNQIDMLQTALKLLDRVKEVKSSIRTAKTMSEAIELQSQLDQIDIEVGALKTKKDEDSKF